MEVDGAPDAPAEVGPRPTFTLPIFKTVRPMQSQYGINYQDFTRYRRFCASRLQTLYKALKLSHGKTKYQKRRIEPTTVTEVRYLHVPLFNTERAWAYAMELKQDLERKVEPRKRGHLIRRLAKACAFAAELLRLVQQCCDSRSALEAEAYLAMMQGTWLMQKETSWEKALAKFTRASKLLTELSKVGDIEQQSHCLALVEEMEPSLRFCSYQLSRKGGAPPSEAQLAALADADGATPLAALRPHLDALLAAAEQAAAASATVLTWHNRKIAVRDDRVRAALQAATELAAQADGGSAMDAEGAGAAPATTAAALLPAAEAALHRQVLDAYRAVRDQIQNALKTVSAGEAEARSGELEALDMAVRGLAAEWTIRRTQRQLAAATAAFEALLDRAAQGRKLKEKEAGRPEEVVGLVDALLAQTEELSELAARLGGRDGEALHEACYLQAAHHAAARCYYAAHALLLAPGRQLEAAALFERAAQRAADAQAKLQEAMTPDNETAAAAQALRNKAAAYRVVAHAGYAAERLKQEDGVAAGVSGMSLEGGATAGASSQQQQGGQASQQQQQQQQQQAYLAESLDTWASFAGPAGGKGAGARVAPVPPRMTLIPARPIMLDTAFNYVGYPSLEHRLAKQQEAKASLLGTAVGTASRIFGWGGSSAK